MTRTADRTPGVSSSSDAEPHSSEPSDTVQFLELLERRREERAGFQKLEEFFPNEIAELRKQPPHEQFLIGVIDERRIELMGSVNLGLNDALVELTGALAGFTLAGDGAKIEPLN